MVCVGLNWHFPKPGQGWGVGYSFYLTCPRASQLWAQEGPEKAPEFTHNIFPMKNDLRSSWEKHINKPANTNKARAPICYQQLTSHSAEEAVCCPFTLKAELGLRRWTMRGDALCL